MPALRPTRLLAATVVLTAALGSALLSTGTATAAGAATDSPAVASPSDSVSATAAGAQTDVRDPSCTPTSTTALCSAPETLLDVRIGDVHPTQPSLGYDEVYYKLGRYSPALSKDAVNKEFDDWCEANGQEEAATVPAGATITDPSTFTCAVAVGSETAETIAPMKTVVIGPAARST